MKQTWLLLIFAIITTLSADDVRRRHSVFIQEQGTPDTANLQTDNTQNNNPQPNNTQSDTSQTASQQNSTPQTAPNDNANTAAPSEETTKQVVQTDEKEKRQNRLTIIKEGRRSPIITNGYANLTIPKLAKKNKQNTNFFVGINAGLEMPILKYSFKDFDTQISNTSKSTTYSIGGKIGIISEDKYIGGRFYGEISYMKVPKFQIITAGLDVDLLINYYRTDTWSIGGFLGIGGGMYGVMFADDELKDTGKVPFSPIGWFNIGLVRYVYKNNSFELTFRYPYVFASIYKDSSTFYKNNGTNNSKVLQNQTIGYKLQSSSLIFSYAYQF